MAKAVNIDDLMLRTPPHDAEVERKLLGACLVSDDAATPDEGLESLDVVFQVVEQQDFVDPFHAWLFAGIAESRRVWKDTRRQLRFLIARNMRHDAARLHGVRNLPLEIAKLLVTAEGHSCCGLVSRVRLYVNHLRMVRAYREKFEVAILQLQDAFDEWDSAIQSGRVCRPE